MTQKRAILTIFVLVLAVSVFGQTVHQERVMIRHEAGVAAAGMPANIQYLAAEMAVTPVKNAPYSAQSVTETLQVLADGNRIQRKMTSAVYRDSEGRTRREQSMAGFGLGVPDGPEMVFISDPVAGVSYSLDPRARTAFKTAAMKVLPPMLEQAGVPGVPGKGIMVFERRVAGPGGGDVIRHVQQGDVKEEPLGKRVIEGVECDGTRAVTVIPAGQMGNERPIEVVSERWFSPELKTLVMSKNSDPRMGETTFRLTNISRAEPPRSLFEVPPDYTVTVPPHYTVTERK